MAPLGHCHAQQILIAYIPNAAGSFCDAQIDFCHTGSSTAAISIVALGAHEMMEAMTDPFVSAWYVGNGWEIVDKCGEPVCVSLTTGTFALPTVYSGASQKCVP